ncbi:alpha-L-fucosidase [Flagellimonas myxillae]|uniref:alpha-L-fucosidase n=1 Tax=Flagellimonas myxillae TaxID=2942214 RepID=UPI00201F31CC|nr:alpha-L-fucosidase [Muricauda myxillae]MCL6268231.1 alpha-L-fucosidase [Muricauda myxillae]
MRKVLLSTLAIIALFSCQNKEEQLMATQSTIALDDDDTNDSIVLKAAHVVPTENQYQALKNEFIAFIHFGPNTFTKKEWGNGFEDPEVFNLHELDTDQWCKSMKAAQMKMVILTVKHHDGFVLWQSRYTKHGIMSTPYQNGKGDVLKELAESCKKYGLKLGVYLSPADLFQIESPEGLYGNLSEYSDRVIPRPVAGRPFANPKTFTFKVDDYNEYFLNQLFELLTEYGPIHEVWFDGAHPKRKGGQKYNYLAWKELISTLAPEAVVFGKQDVRWCGNESGGTRDTEWNVVPYSTDPSLMNRFPDITAEDIGSREKLYKAEYLHYQQAETNTSIREGWFYRDEDTQKVRSADDVFDIYERSVGGNSTFLLNIPPNLKGKFSPEDVAVLEEVGKRIAETYTQDLFEGAKGPKNVLDDDDSSYALMNSKDNSLTIQTPQPITINRIAIQEAINTHGERIESHKIEAKIDGQWTEIAKASNIGYKRILRFPEVTSSEFRITALETRAQPALSKVSAHFYRIRPPQLQISRTLEGMLQIMPKQHDFNWKPHGENTLENLNSKVEIRFTTDGSVPTKDSKLFTEPVPATSVEVKAVAMDKEVLGSMASKRFGILKAEWKPIGSDSEAQDHGMALAMDENPDTYWQSNSKSGKKHYLEIDLGSSKTLTGFAYTPQKEHAEGMIEKGSISISDNGKDWKKVMDFEFGNLINDPKTRQHAFTSPISTKFIRIESNVIAGGHTSAAIAELDFFE